MNPCELERDLLCRQLDPIVAERFGASAAIAAIERRPARHVSSYDCEVVTVRVTTGDRFEILLKDFGNSRRSKDEPLRRREREVRVYRELLRHADVDTPRYYGSVRDGVRGRFWLLLELVDGLVVQHGHTEYELLAARWLARFQGRFVEATERLLGCDYLIRHDATFYRSKSESALRDVARISTTAARRLERVAARYEKAVAVMASQPLTLVHGAYIPWHILADATRRPIRVCAVDWELSACGATLYDLAFFTDDLEPREREPIWDAYRESAVNHGVPVPDGAEMARVVDCFRLHRVFDWLSRSVEKEFQEKKVLHLTDRAERLSTRVPS